MIIASAVAQARRRVALFQLFGVDVVDRDPRLVGDRAVGDRLVQALVGIDQVDVLADHRDVDRGLGILHGLDDPPPLGEVGRAGPDVELLDHALVESFLVKAQRHFVNRFDVARRDDAVLLDVAEVRNFGLDLLVQRPIAAAEQDVGLDAEAGQLLDAVLGRLGLELAGGRDERHQGQMDVEHVVASVVPAELADRLEERQALDIADGAADLDDREVETFGGLADALFYFVGDVRDDLDGRAEVIAAALLLDHGVVDLAGGAVVAPAHPGFEEALVVAEIEIGFRAVVGHENLAVLQRAHRARIDVDIRVHLEQRHAQSARLEQRAERSRRQSLAQRRNHAAAYEDELGLVVAIHCWTLPGFSRQAAVRARALA